MTKRSALPPRDRDEEAADWCLTLSERALTADEHIVFEQWLADPENASALQDQAALWDLTEAAANHPEMLKARSHALDQFRLANAEQWEQQGRRFQWGRAAAAFAAAAAVLVLALTLFLPGRDGPVSYATAIGERRIAMLEDGSRLTLDADSEVEVEMRPERRLLKVVRGRAKFDVAKDPLRPFSVQADQETVVAVGTSFSVEKLDKAVAVVLYEGRVAVLRGSEQGQAALEETLRPGRSLRLEAAGRAVLEPVAVDRSLAWTEGRLDFAGEPLAAAVARVNRYARQPIVLGADVPASVRVTGVFDASDPSAFLEGVAALNHLSVRREGNRLLLTGG